MIVRMSKITIMGPKELSMDTLTCIHQLGFMQIDENINTTSNEQELPCHPILPNRRSLALQRFYQSLKKRIDHVLTYFPETEENFSNLRVQAALHSLS